MKIQPYFTLLGMSTIARVDYDGVVNNLAVSLVRIREFDSRHNGFFYSGSDVAESVTHLFDNIPLLIIRWMFGRFRCV